eukprot:gene58042-biopygen90087
MREELGGCSVEACTAAINCCAEGGAAEAARRLFDAMPGWGMRRDAMTFGAAVKACGRDWGRADRARKSSKSRMFIEDLR